MGLRINQNIAAMNAYRNLTVTDGQMSKSLEKLSSGFRINRAADDAAGLSISEHLRSQIGGLQVAVRNAQDGVSVVQTADGALTETHAILQRMRDLAVQASNGGSQDSNAQSAADTEFTQLKSEIDRISGTTKFGGANLLDGTYGNSQVTTTSATITGLTQDATTTDTNYGQYTITPPVAASFSVAGTINGTVVAATDIAAVTAPAAGTGGYTASQFQTAMQTQVDTALSAAITGAGGTYTNGDVKVEVSDQGGGSWAVKLTSTKSNSLTTAADSGGGTPGAVGISVGTANASPPATGTFQVGANNSSQERIAVAIGPMDSAALGVSTGNLLTTTSAQNAVTSLDTAIAKVSDQRATLGAYQNRFEHTINNLNVAVENLTASESRIRDTDMAKEMTMFTRSQILSQAGTAMLAQANQAPQNVMQLLRG